MPLKYPLGDLAQTYTKCRSALSTLLQQLPTQDKSEEAIDEESRLWKAEIARLDVWATEHHVEDGFLDHSLRESSLLRDQALSLLQNLQDLKVSSDGSDYSSTSEDALAMSTKFYAAKDVLSADESASIYRSAIETDPVISTPSLDLSKQSSLDVYRSAATGLSPHSRRLIEYSNSTITLLYELGPSLRDPSPHDRMAAEGNELFSPEPDLQHVATKYQSASDQLKYRLGYANYERRQAFIRSRIKYEEKMGDAPRETHNASFDPNRQWLKDMKYEADSRLGRSERPRRREPPAPGSSPSSSSASSVAGTTHSESELQSSIGFTSTSFNENNTQGESQSIFSAKNTISTRPTDLLSIKGRRSEGVADVGREFKPRRRSNDVVDERHNVRSQRLMVPKPPPPNQLYSGEQFLCPYCLLHVKDLTTSEEWTEHVFLDLMPYMCTYDDCPRPKSTYASQRIWWDHETVTHRQRKFWLCGPCQRQNFEYTYHSEEEFKQHILDQHPIISTPDQIGAIIKVCEKRTSPTPPRNICPLCMVDITPQDGTGRVELGESLRKVDDKIRQHVAEHLEQLALFVVLPSGSRQFEQDNELDLFDDDSEADRKSGIASIAISDWRMSKGAVRDENVKRFFNDQDAHTNPSRLGPSRTLSPERAKDTKESMTTSKNQPAIEFPLNTVLHPRNELFFGNDEILGSIHDALQKPGTIFTIYGLGGVGKTMTAVEYSYAYRNEYDGVFWLQADTPPGLSESYIQMTMALGIAVGGDNEIRAVERGREWLEQTDHRWLLILDNVETWDSIYNFLPRQLSETKGSILITSQNDKLIGLERSAGGTELKTLNPEAGARMLLKYLRRDNYTEKDLSLAREISGFVGGLPVAIAHVAGYADYSRYELDELLETFREWRRVAGWATDQEDDLSVTFRQAAFSYDDILIMVWNITLRELSKEAQDLTYILAYLNCEAVPESMIWSIHESRSLAFLDKREKIKAKNIKKSLIQRRLVQCRETDGEMCFSVHRTLQRIVQDTLSTDPAKQQSTFDQAVSLVREVFPTPSPWQQPTPETWLELSRLLPHLYALRDSYIARKPAIKGSVEFARLLSEACVNHWERGITKAGLMLLRTAEEVLDSTTLDQDDELRANIHTMIALMLDNTGLSNRQESLTRREKALQLRSAKVKNSTAVRYDDEVLWYNARLDYAISLLQFHEYTKVEPIMEACLRKYKEWGTPEEIPYEYAKYYNKLALVRLYQRRFEEAIELATQGVEWMGKSKNLSLQSRFDFDLACILLQSGRIDESLKLHEQIFENRLERHGRASEMTLHSMYAMGAIWEVKGENESAEYWYKRALGLHHAAAWSEEAISRTQYHLARVLRQSGEMQEADELQAQALETLYKILAVEEGQRPCLKPVPDSAIAVLFDHIITVYGARFTSIGILDYVY